MKRLVGVLASAFLGGCASNGLLQTAHTTPPAAVRMALGGSEVSNQLSNQIGRPAILSVSAEIGARLGLTSFLDVGVAPLFRDGAAVDLKANVIPSASRFALAPRVRVGYSDPQGSKIRLVEAGLISSYRFFTSLEPYAAIQFANHWMRYPIQKTELTASQTMVPSDGYGDSLLKAHVGIDVTLAGGFGVIAEYGYWKPIHNDPGDGYRFLDNHVYSCALRFEGGH